MLCVARYTLAAATITLTLVGCQDATGPNDARGPLSARSMMSHTTGEQAPLVLHVVVPQATAPEITWVPAGNPDLNRHYVWLDTLLGYLADQYPAEGWSRFLEDDGTPKWSQIAVSGTSQGAGQAALIGKLRHVDRVVMFSGPPEQRVPQQVDPWISIGETPAAKYFALFHDRDHLVVGIRLNLPALDMERFGAPVQAELSEPPYGGTHILFTDLRPTLGYDRPNPHQSTAKDTNTPLGPDGTPLLRDAWRYLLGEPPHGGRDVAAGPAQH